MNSGRELDREIAEKVMGYTDLDWQEQRHLSRKQLVGIRPDERPSPYTGHRAKYLVPKYSTDIDAAWEVVGRMRELGWSLMLVSYPGARSECQVTFHKNLHETGAELSFGAAPHAICLAALKAVSS